MPDAAHRLHALVPCAGSGARAGTAVAKQYVEVAGRPLVAHTLAALARVARLDRILVVVGADDRLVDTVPIDGRRITVARCGGRTRAASVAAGLAEPARIGALPTAWVLVHAAARCLIRAEWVDALIDACLDDPVGGLLAVRAADTLKEAGAEDRVTATLPRERIWHAQTPQMFRLGVLADALARAGDRATDEASAIEAIGLQPKLVRGSPANIKVTHPEDFAIAAALLRERAIA
jgi:2-C-methyl-D-erythritol 4-phosphate cytidylyltransferase